MENLNIYIEKELTWLQPDVYIEDYELCGGESIIGTLKFRSKYGTLATAESAEGQWTFKRVGFFSPKISIRQVGTDSDIATFKFNTWQEGGEVVLQDGTKYRATNNFWHTRMSFVDDQDQVLLKYPDIGGMFRRSVTLKVYPAAAGIEKLSWLVMLSWYLVVMMQRETAEDPTLEQVRIDT
jgi:hypothetical protein